MADQLTFELEGALPRLPKRLRPMLPRTAARPFDSPLHLFEPSWGGCRTLAFIEPLGLAPSRSGGGATANRRPARTTEMPTHSLRLLDPSDRDLAQILPELADLPERVAARSAILDGELIVVDRYGHPDRSELSRRLLGGAGHPVVYLAFDLLYLDGRPLLAEPLERRRALLGSTIVAGSDIVALPAIAGEGLALFDAVVAQGIAGMMCRERRSPYLPGVRSTLWQYVEAGSEPKPAPVETGAAAVSSTAPVLALIRRLPLDE